MQHVKILPFFFAILFSLPAISQVQTYDADWKQVKTFEEKGLTRSALDKVISISREANKTGNEAQQVKSAMYQLKFRSMLEPDGDLVNLRIIDSLITGAKVPARNIYQSMKAEMLYTYWLRNSYRFNNRTALTGSEGNDPDTWSPQRIVAASYQAYLESLQQASILQNTPIGQFDPVIEKGKNTRELRPTLYDLLAHRAFVGFSNTANPGPLPANAFNLNDPAAFAPANVFAVHKFAQADTSSGLYYALMVLQELTRFHLKDGNRSALLDLDLIRLAFVKDRSFISNKNELFEQSLNQLIIANRDNPAIAQAYYLKGELHMTKGFTYDPFTNAKPKGELVIAKAIFDSAVRIYPGTAGAISSQNQLNSLIQPNLSFEIEKVNSANLPFRGLLTVKNVSRVYFRIIPVTREYINKQNGDSYMDRFASIQQLPALKSWDIAIPNSGDMQSHSMEFAVEPVPTGMYIIMASLDKGFKSAENSIAYQTIYVSNISYILNSRNELFVLDRETGKPLAGASVQVWENTYDYTKRLYVDAKKEKYTTDNKGFVQLVKNTAGRSQLLEIEWQKDHLFTDEQNYNGYYVPDENGKLNSQTFFFTDRSIYRPGQTVQFKGIVINKVKKGEVPQAISKYATKVFLFDANGQKVSTLLLTTNEFGSYSGQFILPKGLLTGNFSIRDSVNNSTQYFQVEEYKRPKFNVEFKPLTGTYRLNDTLSVSGTALAYAGNTISNARYVYRVTRQANYPIFYGGFRSRIFPPGPRTPAMEISNGSGTTDAAGNFMIRFAAIPDDNLDGSRDISFQYTVQVDITDVNGEVRSSNTAVRVGYKAVKLEITTPDELPADSLGSIRIYSQNLNGVHEKARVQLLMEKLVVRGNFLRERYWKRPDQFILSQSEYKRLFPNDVYDNEDDPSTWAIDTKVIDMTDTTSADGRWKFSQPSVPAGFYKITVRTTDRFGETVETTRYIHLTGQGDNSTAAPLTVTSGATNAVPGQTVTISMKTSLPQLWVVQGTERMNLAPVLLPVSITNGTVYTIPVTISEKDRGGILVHYAYVWNNRMYSGSQAISVPWTNKKLEITYATFRDKLLPGSPETWTLNITGANRDRIASELLVNMYDASLDQFKTHTWTSLSSIFPSLNTGMRWLKPGFISVRSEERDFYKNNYKEVPEKSYDRLLHNGWMGENYNRIYSSVAAPQVSEVVVVSAYNVRGENSKIAARSKSQSGEGMADATTQVNAEEESAPPAAPAVQFRKDFRETAFFFPQLKTDAQGNISFSFTMPEALTRWKFMALAHTTDLANAYSEKTIVTQKTLMIQPNLPRFVREGDQMELWIKVASLHNTELTGTARLELFDATTNKPVDGWFKNVFPNQYFTATATESALLKFPIGIPLGFGGVLGYRVTAMTKDGSFSDGEEGALPVVTNRMLVTETFPINMRNTNSKTFRFDKLLQSGNSGSLTHQALTVEYTSNPAWYAVQALPYLAEAKYDCSEQEFNRLYANLLAAQISKNIPRLQAIFEKWKNDTTALLSNLSKNEELKSALLKETPWVLEAESETAQRRNIALLFDMTRMANETAASLAKLTQLQTPNGGFAWFKGGRDDRYITQYILAGIGHLQKLGAGNAGLKSIAAKALVYADARLAEDYRNLIKNKADLKKNQLNSLAIQYLYIRSFFLELPVSNNAQIAYSFYQKQAKQFWLSQTRYMQGMIALSAFRAGDKATATAIRNSLSENAIHNEELGMYWKEYLNGGYYWHQAPIEAQALFIEVYAETANDRNAVDDLKTWLLKRKQTTHWPTSKATADACYALLLQGSDWLAADPKVSVRLGNTLITPDPAAVQAGTGYFKQTIPGDKVQQGMGNIEVKIQPSAGQPQGTTSWGAVYWQYFEDLDRITSAATSLKIEKQLYLSVNSVTGPKLQRVNDGDALHVGDKVIVRLILRSDRDLEYIHLKDMRAAAMEPVNVLSQYKWQGGLGYYESTQDASTNFFFDWLPRGTYVFEYPMFVTQSGDFSNGIATVQSMYAPEFSSHSAGIRINTEAK